MEFGGRGSYEGKGKGKANETNVLCHCALPAKNAKAWTDKNPGRRFYECERWKTSLDCGFFQWIDEGEPFGWQKNEIWQKKKTIMELKKIISKLQVDLGKNAYLEEDIKKRVSEALICPPSVYFGISPSVVTV
ncbi:hypothetical protein Bca52824_023792 [Brassica carinata]|uniref:GRF-type domain-containing protein n=1 Tax=Brassica carinata TaxID=52824 RepID=A0A8X8ATK0_BRACI|nr:hypothetical protein Bca52824_023792 [Brassica carinata]